MRTHWDLTTTPRPKEHAMRDEPLGLTPSAEGAVRRLRASRAQLAGDR